MLYHRNHTQNVCSAARGMLNVLPGIADSFLQRHLKCLVPLNVVPPVTATGNSVSAGQLLCGGLFSTDSVSNWCAAVALAHALQENAPLKEQLLRVQLATSLGNPPVSLLQQCTNILSQVQHPSLFLFTQMRFLPSGGGWGLLLSKDGCSLSCQPGCWWVFNAAESPGEVSGLLVNYV